MNLHVRIRIRRRDVNIGRYKTWLTVEIDLGDSRPSRPAQPVALRTTKYRRHTPAFNISYRFLICIADFRRCDCYTYT